MHSGPMLLLATLVYAHKVVLLQALSTLGLWATIFILNMVRNAHFAAELLHK